MTFLVTSRQHSNKQPAPVSPVPEIPHRFQNRRDTNLPPSISSLEICIDPLAPKYHNNSQYADMHISKRHANFSRVMPRPEPLVHILTTHHSSHSPWTPYEPKLRLSGSSRRSVCLLTMSVSGVVGQPNLFSTTLPLSPYHNLNSSALGFSNILALGAECIQYSEQARIHAISAEAHPNLFSI